MRMHFFIISLLTLVFYSCASVDQDFTIDKESQSIPDAPSLYTKSFSRTDATLSQSGDVTVLDSKIVVQGDTVASLFEINAPTAGEFFLSVFMIPEDSSFYFIRCNGNDSEGLLRPKKPGWQSILLADDDGTAVKVLLKQGKNEITFHSSSNDFPEIEIVRMTMSESEIAISTEAYDRYVEKLLGGTIKTKSTSLPILPSVIYNTTDYQYELDCPLLYSFTKTIVLTESVNTVTVSCLSTTSSSIIVDIFKDNVYSWKGELTPPGGVTYNFPPGTYTVHLRCRAQDSPFYAPINIRHTGNINQNYTVCPISGFSYETQTDNYTGGTVNFFTCHATEDTDPVMYLENAYGSTIGSVNDNYSGNGDFDWGTNARIKTGYNSSPLVHIFNASASLPEGTCDLYVRVPFQSVLEQVISGGEALTYHVLFPSLEQDDSMQSGYASGVYNCFAWAGDLIYDLVNPLDPASPYYVDGTSELGLFDGYFASRGYSRTYYEEHAGVALWKKDSIFTHASIRKNARSIYPHGYDWESKIGSGPRIFHEKNSLEGYSRPEHYGEIAYYYEHNPLLTVSSYTTEQPTFSYEGKNLLTKMKASIEEKRVEESFKDLYDKWEWFCQTPEIVIQSNPVFWKNDDTYRDLRTFCIQNQDASILLTIERLIHQEIRAGYLLEDIFPAELDYLKKDAYHRYEEGMKILPTTMGNYFRLAEGYLRHLEIKGQ